MDRKPYQIDVAGDDVASATVFLTEAEADAFAFVATELARFGNRPGTPSLTIEKARGDCAGCGGLGEYPSWSGQACETCTGVGTVLADSPYALNGAIVEGTAVRA